MPADFPGDASSPTSSAAQATGRATPDEITIFDSVGFALEDFSALRFLHKLLLEERGERRQIDLVPELQDPKDLYGGTPRRGSRTRPPAPDRLRSPYGHSAASR